MTRVLYARITRVSVIVEDELKGQCGAVNSEDDSHYAQSQYEESPRREQVRHFGRRRPDSKILPSHRENEFHLRERWKLKRKLSHDKG